VAGAASRAVQDLVEQGVVIEIERMSYEHRIARAASAARRTAASSACAGALLSTSRVAALILLSVTYAPVGFAPYAFASDLEQNVISVDEYRIKAAYLYGLTKFILWPNEHTWDSSSPLDICVYGNNPFSNHFETIDALTSRGHPIVVRALEPWRSALGCRILFIGADNVLPPQLASGELAEAGVLTVGESEEFLRSGGLVSLLTEGSGVRIALNYADAKRAGFIIDGGLLDVAKKVD
jgi:hypothetical protein